MVNLENRQRPALQKMVLELIAEKGIEAARHEILANFVPMSREHRIASRIFGDLVQDKYGKWRFKQ